MNGILKLSDLFNEDKINLRDIMPNGLLTVRSISISGYLFPVMWLDEKPPKQSMVGREKLGSVIWRHEIFCKAAMLKRKKFTQKVYIARQHLLLYFCYVLHHLYTHLVCVLTVLKRLSNFCSTMSWCISLHSIRKVAGINAPPPACLFFTYFWVDGGFTDKDGSSLTVLSQTKTMKKWMSEHERPSQTVNGN